MNKTHQALVRLTPEHYTELKSIADETNEDVAKLIRHAVAALIKHYRRSGNRLVLPIDFSEVVQVLSLSAQKNANKTEEEKSQHG